MSGSGCIAGCPGRACGRKGLIEAVELFEVPVVALGGVDPQRLPSLKGSGAVGCAAIGAIWATDKAPIDGLSRSPLVDVQGIEARTGALVDAVSAAFAKREAR